MKKFFIILVVLFVSVSFTNAISLHLSEVADDDSCTISTFPFTENFDSYTGVPGASPNGVVPNCWTSFSTYNSNYPCITNMFASSDSNSLLLTTHAPNHTVAVLPKIDENYAINALSMTFKLRTYINNFAGTIQIGVMTDSSDVSTFQLISSFLSTNVWVEHTVYFTQYTGTGRFLAFKLESTSSVYNLMTFIDDLVIDYSPSCFAPTNLAISNVSGTSALLSWTHIGTPDNYTVEISDTSSGYWASYITSDSSIILTGLTELSSYQVSIFANCSGSQSDTAEFHFFTVCGQDNGIIVGTTTTDNNGNNLPFSINNNYSYSQQIFLSNELGNNATDIRGIAFQYYYASSSVNNITVYIGHTSDSLFSTSSDWKNFSTMTQVYSGPINFINTGTGYWVPIIFQNTFHYNGTDNIVVAIDNNTGSSNPLSYRFYTHSSGRTAAIYLYSNTDINPAAPSSGSLSSYENNIKFFKNCDSVNCPLPNIIISNITPNTADVNIVPVGGELSWDMEYKPVTDTVWISLGNIANTSYSLTNLIQRTYYDIRVRSVCSPTEVSDWDTTSFRTGCGTIDLLPWSDNFDTYTSSSPDCWTINSTFSTSPSFETSTYFSAPRSLYFYSTAYTYSIGALPEIDSLIPINTTQVSFKLNSINASYRLDVGVMTDPTNANTFTLIERINPANVGVWESYIVELSSYSGQGHYVAFRCERMDVAASNSMYIDDIVLDPVSYCSRPRDLTAANIAQTGADIYWSGSSHASYYELAIDSVGFDPDSVMAIQVYDTFYNIAGMLTPGTEYDAYVRTVCGYDRSLWTNKITFITPCTAITEQDLPYREYFDSCGTDFQMPSCWTKISGNNGNYPCVVSNNYFSSPGALSFSSYSTSVPLYAYAIMPPFDSALPTDTLELSFKYYMSSSSGSLQVGVMNNPSDTTSFTLLQNITPANAGNWEDAEFDLAAYTGTGQYVAFRVSSGSGMRQTYIDNLEARILSPCTKPIDPIAYNIGMDSATVSWTERGTATSWNIEYGPAGFTQGTGTTVAASTNPYSFSGLAANTNYDFYVQSVCGVDMSSYWSTKGSFRTMACDFPDQCNYTLQFYDSYGDGWNDAAIGISVNSVSGDNYTMNTGSVTSYTVPLCDQSAIALDWISGEDDNEISFTITGPSGDTVFNCPDASQLTGTFYSFSANCSATNPCPAPTNLTINNITDVSANFSWNTGGDETSWSVDYKAHSSSNYTTASCSNSSYTITGLTICTEYDVRIKAICDQSTESNYIDTTFFTSCVPYYTISATAGPWGTISPSGIVSVAENNDVTFTMTADPGYSLCALLIDGTGIDPVSPYTFSNVTANHTINALFLCDGIDENNNNAIVNIYPNPTARYLNIEINANKTQPDRMEIYDMYGKLMFSEKIQGAKLTVNIENFASGIYLLKLFKGNESIGNQKVVKQ